MDQKNDLPLLPNVSIDTTFDPHDHNYVQRGYFLECDGQCKAKRPHAQSIKSGTMLIGQRGNWQLVSEGGLMRAAA